MNSIGRLFSEETATINKQTPSQSDDPPHPRDMQGVKARNRETQTEDEVVTARTYRKSFLMVAATLSSVHVVVALSVDLALSLAAGKTHLTHHDMLLHVATLHILSTRLSAPQSFGGGWSSPHSQCVFSVPFR